MEETFWGAVRRHWNVGKDEVRSDCREPRLVQARDSISLALSELGWKGAAIASLINKVQSCVTQGVRRAEKRIKASGEANAEHLQFMDSIAPTCRECGQRMPVKRRVS